MTTKRTPIPELSESALSLIYRGALPDILRLIAHQLEQGNAEAEHFSARVGQGSFDLQATITLLGAGPKNGQRMPRTNYPGA